LSAARNAVNVQVLMRLVRIDNQMKSGKVPPCPSGFATAFGEQKQREPRCTADLTGAAAKRPASPVAFILPTPTCASLTAPRTPTALERKAGHRNLLQSPARQYAAPGSLGRGMLYAHGRSGAAGAFAYVAIEAWSPPRQPIGSVVELGLQARMD